MNPKRIWLFFGKENPECPGAFGESLVYTSKPEHNGLALLASEYVDAAEFRKAELLINTLRMENKILSDKIRGDDGSGSDHAIQETGAEILPAANRKSESPAPA